MVTSFLNRLNTVIVTLQSTTEESALDIANFMALFFETFGKFKGRNFHLTGESYAVCMPSNDLFHDLDTRPGSISTCICVGNL